MASDGSLGRRGVLEVGETAVSDHCFESGSYRPLDQVRVAEDPEPRLTHPVKDDLGDIVWIHTTAQQAGLRFMGCRFFLCRRFVSPRPGIVHRV